jgi:cytoskeletal protein RodZ
VADYSAASNEQPEPEDKFPLEIHQEPNRDLNPRRSYLPLAFAIAALVGVLVGYAFWAKSRPHGAESAGGSTQQAAPTAATAAPPVTVPAPAPSASASPAREGSTASSPSQPAQAAPVKPEKVFVVQVTAKEDSWVSIVADGKSVMERVLTADKKKKIKAGKTLILRTGNAGGIEVTFNGVSLGSLGNENEPRTLTFNAAGLVQ